jgi:hypothetical protein
VTFEGVTVQLLLHGDYDRIRISRWDTKTFLGVQCFDFDFHFIITNH